MPDQPQCIPDPETGPHAAVPPTIAPEDFERFEGFRETTLAYFLDKEANVALRTVGQLLYTIVLEYWPQEPEGSFRHSARALIADMRHIQGTWSTWAAGRTKPPPLLPMTRTCPSSAPGLAQRVKEIADALEKELGSWRGEE